MKEELNNDINVLKGILLEKLRDINSDHDYSSLIINHLESAEEYQQVIDYISEQPYVNIHGVISLAFDIFSKRYYLENKDKEYVSPYAAAVRSFFNKKFPSYPELSIEKLELSFIIRSATKNTPLVYSIIESLSSDAYSINVNSVHISISSEKAIVDQLMQISDLLVIIKKWKSTELKVNDIEIDVSSEFGYIIDFLREKHNVTGWYQKQDVKQLENSYYSHKEKKTRIEYPDDRIKLSKTDLSLTMTKVIEKYVDQFCYRNDIEHYDIDQNEQVIVVEDSLLVDFCLIPKPLHWEDREVEDWQYPEIVIQELTHNDLFKFNWAAFKRNFYGWEVGLYFLKYHGVNYYRKEIDRSESVNTALPNLELLRRQQDYSGDLYHVVILKMEDVDGYIAYGVGYTKNDIKVFIGKLCKELQEKGSATIKHGISCLPGYGNLNKRFIEAFLSWKGKNKLWRIENKFSFCYDDVYIKNDLELWDLPKKYLRAAYEGSYADAEYGTYRKPINKWKSEELVFNLTKKLYRDYQVIYQYRPFFLSTEYGNMSYDVYICGLKIAIEYQGKQHFEPVSIFGGEDNFIKQKQRDELKAKRSTENGIKLVYVYYWEDITPELIKKKIDQAICETSGNQEQE